MKRKIAIASARVMRHRCERLVRAAGHHSFWRLVLAFRHLAVAAPAAIATLAICNKNPELWKAIDEDEKMDKDWEHFAQHFDKVHSDFMVVLKEKHNNITPNELKLCTYLRMNLSTKEYFGEDKT